LPKQKAFASIWRMLGLGKKKQIEPTDEINDEVMNLSDDGSISESRIYEVSYLIVPTFTEEMTVEEAVKIRAFLTEKGAEILTEGTPKKLLLAYPMRKSVANKNTVYTDAFFGWIKFVLPQEKINEIKEAFDQNEKLIRFLIIKTTKETPLAKLAPRRIYKKRSDEPRIIKEESGPIDEAQVDKEIEELLIN